ncbi:peptidoglycan DD-metalloendopeptidase family protein [Arthrobacter oryzae]|uniref:peptidoglycan DD-metalloendopeptidase family protein n=1 Tax=Arthrobacter oryzae TaxID=409290 RepID=UPI0030C90577
MPSAVVATSSKQAPMGGPGIAPWWPDAFTKPLGIAPDTVSANTNALISYSRSDIRTISKSGKRELNAASEELRRPPAGSLMAPLEMLTETSGFGLRVSPLSGVAGEFHWGQDFAAACGTRVYAADAGVVRAVGWHPWGGGNRVEIDHGNGLITTYNHLEGIAVKKGDSVQVGEVIAKVGTTGSSTGCHLHFETILNGVHANPLDFKFLPTRQLDELGNIDMISYLPGGDAPAGDPTWAIPVSADNSHVVAGGEAEVPRPETPSATATGTPSASATPSATESSTATATPPPAGTATPPPTGTATPPPTGTATATPTPPPTQTPTPAPTETGQSTEAASPTESVTAEPTAEPATEPAAEPTVTATAEPATEPAAEPTVTATAEPATEPVAEPTLTATAEPATEPVAEPTLTATAEPATEPVAESTLTATAEPTAEPAAEPTLTAAAEPTAEPAAEPTLKAAAEPESTESAEPVPTAIPAP